MRVMCMCSESLEWEERWMNCTSRTEGSGLKFLKAVHHVIVFAVTLYR